MASPGLPLRIAVQPPPLALFLLAMFLGAASAWTLGCGTDDVGPRSPLVGGRCTADRDCVNRCATGATFPRGYCTVACRADSDCPGGAACVAIDGGICLAICLVAADCTAYGVEYQCRRQTSQSGTAGVNGALACVGP